ncbi:MAG: ABC transporter ATP-binding protein [Planctomycetaceae bacterium]
MLIELRRVTRLYGTVLGVNDIDLSLPPGAYGLLGPNGSGKTTLLNLLVGQLSPTMGEVKVFGLNPRNSAELMHKLSYCPSSEGLYANVTSYKWVCYLNELRGYSRSDSKDRAQHWLEVVGLKDAMHRQISGYSRGMRQRTKLAQALSHDADFIILDEPFAGLDPVGRHEMTELLRKRVQDGTSVLFASHVLHDVESLTSQFLLIRGGRVLASGNKDEIYELMVDIPSEIEIECDRPRELAAALVGESSIERVSVKNRVVSASTSSAASLAAALPELCMQAGVHVTRMESGSTSLQELFTSLMKIHRGEL